MDINIGKLLMVLGIILFIIGLIIYFGGHGLISWVGNLPGDIKIEKENYSFYFPLTTMIVLSIILSLVIWIVRKLFM